MAAATCLAPYPFSTGCKRNFDTRYGLAVDEEIVSEPIIKTLPNLRPSYVYDNFSGFALHPSGRLIAKNFYLDGYRGPRFKFLSLIDIQSRRGCLIRDLDGHLLTDPAFSPDGSLIAAVSTPEPYFGISKISIYSSDGSYIKQIGPDGHFFGSPSFSWDGKSVICSVDRNPAYQGEIRSAESFSGGLAICEISLQSSKARLLSTQVFDFIYRTAQDPLGKGTFVSAADPMVPLSPTRNGELTTMKRPDWLIEFDQRYDFPRTFLVSGVTDADKQPKPFISAEECGTQASMMGVTRTRSLLVRGARDNKTMLNLVHPDRVERLFTTNFGINDAAISSDQSLLLVAQWSDGLRDGVGGTLDEGKRITIIDRSSGASYMLRPGDIVYKSGL